MTPRKFDGLFVEKLVAGGFGLARTDEGVVLVEGACPGETVDAEQTGVRSHTPVARVVSIQVPSPGRVVPRCPLYGICGGCDWQHLDYQVQLRSKHEIFKESLGRLGRISHIPPIEIFPSPPWEYRIRAQIKLDHDNRRAGFFRKKSNDVVDVPHCPLLSPAINQLLVRRDERLLAELPPTVKQVRIVEGTGGTIATNPPLSDLASAVKIDVDSVTFTVYGDDFFQSNGPMLKALGTWAGNEVHGNSMIDMYGGVGFFSAMHGSNFASGLLVEAEESQVKRAEENLLQNRLPHIQVRTTTAERFFREAPENKGVDMLVIDPPRAGLTRVVREGIGQCAPSTILYVSCNPPTQARDLGYLINKRGYRISRAALFDLYPQTHHLETAVLLKRT